MIFAFSQFRMPRCVQADPENELEPAEVRALVGSGASALADYLRGHSAAIVAEVLSGGWLETDGREDDVRRLAQGLVANAADVLEEAGAEGLDPGERIRRER